MVPQSIKYIEDKPNYIFISFFHKREQAVYMLVNGANGLIKQVFYPTNIPTQGEYKNNMLTENPVLSKDVSLYNIANPVTKYGSRSNTKRVYFATC